MNKMHISALVYNKHLAVVEQIHSFKVIDIQPPTIESGDQSKYKNRAEELHTQMEKQCNFSSPQGDYLTRSSSICSVNWTIVRIKVLYEKWGPDIIILIETMHSNIERCVWLVNQLASADGDMFVLLTQQACSTTNEPGFFFDIFGIGPLLDNCHSSSSYQLWWPACNVHGKLEKVAKC